MSSDQDAYHALCAYTLSLGDPGFIHQHVVDAFAAQRANEQSKPIGVAFALVGLYLLVEKEWSGKQVQRAHMRLSRRRRAWPSFPLPLDRGPITAIDVVAAPPGPERDRAIRAWCAVVWATYAEYEEEIVALLRAGGIL